MRWVALAGIATAGCGRVGFEHQDAALDVIDIDAATCPTPSSWSAPVLHAALTSPVQDWSPALSGDTLRIVFQSDRTGDSELFEATRASATAMFGGPTALTPLNSMGEEQAPTLSVDGLVIFFTSDRSGAHVLYRATRAAVSAPFDPPVSITIAGAAEVYGPTISATGRELFFNDATEETAYRAVFDGSQFRLDRMLAELGPCSYPSLSADERTIYFSRLDGVSRRLFSATRLSIDAPFGLATLVENADLSGDEDDPEIGKDNMTIAFAGDVSMGNAQIYLSTRTCQ
ncbi:MAG: TolB family protein [Kofleriaceae bacterium]